MERAHRAGHSERHGGILREGSQYSWVAPCSRGATQRRCVAHVAYALALETALLAAAAILVAATHPHPGTAAADGTIALMATAMGIRNATVRHLAVPDLTTTVLTMTLTGLAADSTIAGGSGKGTARRTSAILAMLAGALTGALMLRAGLSLPIGFAAAVALATCLGYMSARGRLVGSHPG